jgi:hypothetical protein
MIRISSSRIAAFVVTAVLLFAFTSVVSATTGDRAIRVTIKDREGRDVGGYGGSFALLVGVSDYTSGWPDLESVPGEIDRVSAFLKEQGFKTEKLDNPTSAELRRGVDDFINRHGFEPSNRLLLFFSGHGHSRLEGRKGYIVPADAPDPTVDEIGFVQKAVEMAQVLTWAKRIEARHALFLFDSCFSGTVFKTRAIPGRPPHISDLTSRPVRQFITAGSAGETVPARSVFVPLLIRALSGGADYDRDGYVTGTELGIYLHQEVLAYGIGQTPQYGKIRDPDLDEGDFVFWMTRVPEAEERAKLSVRANVSGARVLVDGIDLGVTPLAEAPVPAGERRVSVEKSGYRVYARSMTFEPGRSASLSVELQPVPPRTARLYVDTDPRGARVRVLNIGPKFHQGMELEPGSYHLEISSDGWETETRWVRLNAGEDQNIVVRLTATPPSVKEPAFTTGNTATFVGNKRWDWTVFIRGSEEDLARVRCVEYTLHPTFPDPVRTICQRGAGPNAFPLSTNGWGTFRVHIRVMLKDGEDLKLAHQLEFR